MEPFRWLEDVTTIQAFESGVLDLKDFYFTGDDYSYKIEIEAKRRFLQLLKERFNSGIKYRGKTWKWDTVILNKMQELGRFLLNKANSLDFDPSPRLERSDSSALRKRIFELTQTEAQEMGIGKSTLSYLRDRTNSLQPFRVHGKTSRALAAYGHLSR